MGLCDGACSTPSIASWGDAVGASRVRSGIACEGPDACTGHARRRRGMSVGAHRVISSRRDAPDSGTIARDGREGKPCTTRRQHALDDGVARGYHHAYEEKSDDSSGNGAQAMEQSIV